MTESGADQLARDVAAAEMDDALYAIRRTGFADFTYDRLCTREELWAAIDRLDARAYALAIGMEFKTTRDEYDKARRRVRELLGLEPEA